MTDEEKKKAKKKEDQRLRSKKSYVKMKALRESDDPEDREKYELWEERTRLKSKKYYDRNRQKVTTKAVEKYKTRKELEDERLADLKAKNRIRLDALRIAEYGPNATFTEHNRGRRR